MVYAINYPTLSQHPVALQPRQAFGPDPSAASDKEKTQLPCRLARLPSNAWLSTATVLAGQWLGRGRRELCDGGGWYKMVPGEVGCEDVSGWKRMG